MSEQNSQYHTRPVPSIKPLVDSRAAALRDERLIDLGELEVCAGVPRSVPFPLPAAISAALLDLVEQRPIGSVQPEPEPASERLHALVHSACAAYRRAEQYFGASFMAARVHGFVLDFSAELPSGCGGRRYRFVRLHCGPDESGEIAATLSLPDEHLASPVLREASAVRHHATAA